MARPKKRRAIDELEWALQQVNSAQGDQNPNRAAQIRAAVNYGLEVAIAHRGKEPLPPRPDIRKAM